MRVRASFSQPGLKIKGKLLALSKKIGTIHMSEPLEWFAN
jgi:hypothetical protein